MYNFHFFPKFSPALTLFPLGMNTKTYFLFHFMWTFFFSLFFFLFFSFCHIKQFHSISVLIESCLFVLIPLPQPKQTKNWRRIKCFFYSEELKSLKEQTFLMSIRSFENYFFFPEKKKRKRRKSKPLMNVLATHSNYINKWNPLEAKRTK